MYHRLWHFKDILWIIPTIIDGVLIVSMCTIYLCVARFTDINCAYIQMNKNVMIAYICQSYM